ncbi:inactive dual specificity phosphatase 27 isoform X1 [Oncorhynchus mykiss]|uniref:Serine/threonine/tyrosine interacting like 2 n=1 Tax=Oncorhynchus mykiss TaxID=8022 RepID=A0A8K9WYB7_ONCMY|nr:inactive dual specificity phosphatase 27 isoform X1 [Oncorhynchus mykiss]XP_036838054.1 inactive dual specificity phosphatase 27 isoform X1 [Oncorhynchus mykiss]
MASPSEGDQTVPDGEREKEATKVKSIQSHYLRCPSPSSFSVISESRFSMISGSDAESIYMEPIHLSSAIAAKQIINEELPKRGIRTESTPDSMLETAEQLMVEDLYNRVKDMIDDRSPYNTPCVMDIQRAMVQDRLEAPNNPVDEVWNNIFIAEKSVAVNKARLKRMGITHILNAAHGTGVYTGEAFYAGMNIGYMGIEVDDFAESDISPHFRTCAEFLDEALLTHKGKVLVSSMMGESRSAVLVAAYLMIFQHMTIMEALTTLRKKRPINPNEGFLKQLRQLNETLLEERDDDDDDTLSQCSVIDAHTRAHLFDDEESMMGVKAHSIMMEEEEDSQSVMSSVASSAAAAALRDGVFGGLRMGLERAETTEGLALPGKDAGDGGEDAEDGDEDGMSMIREWQRRNEKYQSEEWWEQQLMSEAGDEESLLGGMRGPGATEDLESVTSEDVQAMKERLKRRPRHSPSESVSTASCSSYSDLWKQRLKEIEEQAAARYRIKDDDNNSESTAMEGIQNKKQTIKDDVESVLSDTSSMYNFCKRNKENLTPLERWRVKRIQFGWNKNDEGRDGEKRAGGVWGSGEQGDGDAEAHTPALEDVNLTAYQTWKMKQAKRLGEDNKATKDDIVEMSRGEDSATAKRRQRREELLERSRKTLEESQSMCGWETESSMSGSTLPLSAFFAQPDGSQAGRVANDDNMSMLSGRSSVSQARSTRSQASMGSGIPQGIPQVPMIPVPTMQGPGGEPMVDLSSIQNWIANVVSETLIQKEREMSLPPSQAGSVLSFGGTSSVLGPARRGLDDDKASMLSGASYSSSLAHHGVSAGRAESVLSGRSAASSTSNLSSISGLGSRRSKITTTSVPLYSLFADQVNLQKLDSMDKQMQSEMRNKMACYGVKKIVEDNKRSTLYKKKKPKDEGEEEEEKEDDYLTGKIKTSLPPAPEKKKAPTRSYGLSGCLNLSTALEKEKNTSVDDWLTNVMPPSRKPASYSAEDETDPGPSASVYNFGGQRDSSEEEEEEEEYEVASRYRSRFQADTESRVLGKFSSNSVDSSSYRTRRSYTATEEEEEDEESYTSKRKFTHHSQYESGGETEGRIERKEEKEEEEDVDRFLSDLRQRSRARAEAEMQDDDIVAAWRAQQESKSNGYRSSDS